MILNYFLKIQAHDPHNQHMVSDQIKSIAIGPSRDVRSWPMYYVNGFDFHTIYALNSSFSEN